MLFLLVTGYKSGTESITGLLRSEGFQHLRVREQDSLASGWSSEDRGRLDTILNEFIGSSNNAVIVHHLPSSPDLVVELQERGIPLWLHLRHPMDEVVSSYFFTRKLACDANYAEECEVSEQTIAAIRERWPYSSNSFHNYLLQNLPWHITFTNGWASCFAVAQHNPSLNTPIAVSNFSMLQTGRMVDFARSFLATLGHTGAFPTERRDWSDRLHRGLTDPEVRRDAHRWFNSSSLRDTLSPIATQLLAEPDGVWAVLPPEVS